MNFNFGTFSNAWVNDSLYINFLCAVSTVAVQRRFVKCIKFTVSTTPSDTVKHHLTWVIVFHCLERRFYHECLLIMAAYRPHRTKHDHSAFDFSGVVRGFYWVLYKFSNRSVFFFWKGSRDARTQYSIKPIVLVCSRPHLCKFIGTKERVSTRKEFNSKRTSLEHQHGRRLIVLGHQYGRRDVMWKHSIAHFELPVLLSDCFTVVPKSWAWFKALNLLCWSEKPRAGFPPALLDTDFVDIVFRVPQCYPFWQTVVLFSRISKAS